MANNLLFTIGAKDNSAQVINKVKQNLKFLDQEYKNAKTKEDENKAAQKIIDIYKSRQMTIDAHDVQKLVEKNAAALEQ